MFAWSRLEIWIAVTLAGLIVIAATGQLLLAAGDGQGPIIVEAAVNGQGPMIVETAMVGVESSGQAIPEQMKKLGGAEGRAEEAEEEGAEVGTEEGAEREAEAEREAADDRIDINSAQPSELQRLPGIGPALAARIVEYRAMWGPFAAIEDIMEVSGIGPVKFANFKHLIKVR